MIPLIRSIVSAPKKSYISEDNVRFDLSYVTSRLIVSSGPSSSFWKFYRYPVTDLVEILNKNHGDNWMIWNLRGEGMGYLPEEVDGKVQWFPFPDHQAPSFQLLKECVESIHHFLSLNPDNVALIHCKAGKGRSGTLCCGYMMFESNFKGSTLTVEEVNEVYSDKRMRIGKGVTIKSQLRYLEYWHQYLTQPKYQLDFKVIPQVELSISLKNAVSYTDQRLKLIIDVEGYEERYKGVRLIHFHSFKTSPSYGTEKTHSSSEIIVKDHDFILPLINIKCQDIKISINKFMFCWFNIYFEQGKFECFFESLDGFKGTNNLGIKLFDSVIVSYR
ncbi:putative phosphatidylinositol 3,4,5-trisphosphate 3-phosphatase Ptn1p [[Candida] jaroonii]|uniref:Phosphatidylinositol 3,4,5-trisphosphate 3-phosphatase Ptn1p n=1 Tax=[Candida] jaroonii TaxID=467808 RepID=A0ACA9Y3H7_9ASCO|nr:putative phosphatidylinositol 3,4,5-trisphosphate 3-phosphatase Ptn1p [[Candida] jaroonii]